MTSWRGGGLSINKIGASNMALPSLGVIFLLASIVHASFLNSPVSGWPVALQGRGSAVLESSQLTRRSNSALTRCAAKSGGKKAKTKKRKVDRIVGEVDSSDAPLPREDENAPTSLSPPPMSFDVAAEQSEDATWSAPPLPGSPESDMAAAAKALSPPPPRLGSMPGWYSGSSVEELKAARTQGGSGAAAATSFAERLEAEGKPLTPELQESLGALQVADVSVGGGGEDMLKDIAEFRRSAPKKRVEDGKDGLRRVVSVCGTVLSYNFIIIIGFFLWFLAGCFGKFVLESDVVIDSFTGKWEVLILPLLSTHMGLTFFSAGIEKFGGLSDEPA